VADGVVSMFCVSLFLRRRGFMFRGFVFRSFVFAVLGFAILRPSRFCVSRFCVRSFVFCGFVFAVFNVDPNNLFIFCIQILSLSIRVNWVPIIFVVVAEMWLSAKLYLVLLCI